MTRRCAECKVVFEGRADKLYCTERCQRRAANKRAAKRKARLPGGPRYTYRVTWRRGADAHVRHYKRLANAEAFVREQKRRRDAQWLTEITVERRRVVPWAVVSRWVEEF